MDETDNSTPDAADDRRIRTLTVDDVLFFIDALLSSRQRPQGGQEAAAFAKVQQIRKKLCQGGSFTDVELQRLLNGAKEFQGTLGAPKRSLTDLTKLHFCREMPASESAEGEDELSPEVPLPKIDMSLGARISRGREKQHKQASAFIESVLRAETGGGSRASDIAEAAKQVSPTAMKIAQKRMSIDNVNRAAEARAKTDEGTWRRDARLLAKQKRADDPSVKIAAVGRYIRNNLDSKHVLPVDDRAFYRLIKAMEDDGTLPPKAVVHKKKRTIT